MGLEFGAFRTWLELELELIQALMTRHRSQCCGQNAEVHARALRAIKNRKED